MSPSTRLALALCLAGCQAELSAGLDQAQADAIVMALDQAHIGAERELDERAHDGAGYRVLVARGEVAPALAVLRDRGLPREREPGWDALFDSAGLIPSAAQEQARQAAALGGELARSIETMDGVSRARVHLALPDSGRHPLDGESPGRRASVLVRTEREATIDTTSVRQLVSGAVAGLATTDVAVVVTPLRPPVAREPSLAWVGPFAVTRGAASGLKALLGGSFALNILLAVGLVVSRRRSTRQTAESAPGPANE